MGKNDLENAMEALAAICQDKKGERVVSFELDDRSWITDYVFLVTAKNTVHCKAISEEIVANTPKIIGLSPKEFYDRPQVSGSAISGWIVVDMNCVVLHILTEAMREFYKLDAFFEKRGTAFHY